MILGRAKHFLTPATSRAGASGRSRRISLAVARRAFYAWGMSAKLLLASLLALSTPAWAAAQAKGTFNPSAVGGLAGGGSDSPSLHSVSKAQWKYLSGRYVRTFVALEKLNSAMLAEKPDVEQVKKLASECKRQFLATPKYVAKTEQPAKEKLEMFIANVIDDVPNAGNGPAVQRSIRARSQLRYVADAMNAKSFTVAEIEIEKQKAK
jgi:hypothetical protein